MEVEMEELNEGGNTPAAGGVSGGAVAEYWFWGGITSTQLLWAMSSLRKGYAGDGRFMPFKAFAVASLFVGAAASATVGSLRASGVRSVSLISPFLCFTLSLFI